MVKSRILIFEEDYDTQLFLNLFLSQYFEILECKSKIECFNRLKESDFKLVLLDITPNGNSDGFQIIKQLKGSAQFKHIPVICMSAYVMENDKLKVYAAGADFFLEKPVENSVLLRTINKYILS